MLQKHKLLEKKENIEYAKFEINVMKELKHPNLLRIDFVKQLDNYIFLVLPFSEGEDLNKLYKLKKNEV
jgi:serine/threonine protein kinase